jgi:hypothetical protein
VRVTLDGGVGKGMQGLGPSSLGGSKDGGLTLFMLRMEMKVPKVVRKQRKRKKVRSQGRKLRAIIAVQIQHNRLLEAEENT